MNKKKEVKTVKISVEAVLCNPEDFFQDMLNDGVSIHDAIMQIVSDELVHAKLQHMFPDGYEVSDNHDGWENTTDGEYVIQLTEGWNSWDHDDDDEEDGLERELIASDEDMAHA